MSPEKTQIADDMASYNVLANSPEPVQICDPSIVTKEKIEEQVLQEINKPIYEFVSVINPKTEFARYMCLTRRDK